MRLALIAIDRLRNVAEDCVVCGGPIQGDFAAASAACPQVKVQCVVLKARELMGTRRFPVSCLRLSFLYSQTLPLVSLSLAAYENMYQHEVCKSRTELIRVARVEATKKLLPAPILYQ